jgi:integrase
VAVSDQWHRRAAPGIEPCACGTARKPLYPSAGHKRGQRWLVRWRAPDGTQPGRSFDQKVGKDPNRHADAFDKMIAEQLRAGTYVDPALAEMTLQEYAERWRKGRGHDTERAGTIERHFRLHVYPDPGHPERTPGGGVPVGQHALGLLARVPSLTQGWIAGMGYLEASTAQQVVLNLSAVYAAAMDDGIIGRNPTRAASVTRPSRGPVRARPWTAERVAAVRDALPPRYAIIPELGAATGMRQGEMFGLAPEDVQFLGRRPHVSVSRQVVIIGGMPRFGPVKNRRAHEVPLSPLLAAALSRHLAAHPARPVTLPWHEPGNKQRHGRPVTVRLVLTSPAGGPVRRNDFDQRVWHPALRAAGVTPGRQDGCHALRHTAASVWLRSHVDIVRVAAWLGDTVKVVATTYAHLLPGDDDSDGRAATDAFLASCALDVQPGAGEGAPAQAAELRARWRWHCAGSGSPCRSGARVFGLAVLASQISISCHVSSFRVMSGSCAPGVHYSGGSGSGT